MKTPYQAPPLSLRKVLGAEGYDYLERTHGLLQGLGHRGEEVGSLDARNLGIKSAKPGDLIGIDSDGVKPKVVDPFVENLRAQSSGFLQADAQGSIGASPVDIEGMVTNIVRQEFAAAEAERATEIPTGGLVVGGEADSRRYALFVSWV